MYENLISGARAMGRSAVAEVPERNLQSGEHRLEPAKQAHDRVEETGPLCRGFFAGRGRDAPGRDHPC